MRFCRRSSMKYIMDRTYGSGWLQSLCTEQDKDFQIVLQHKMTKYSSAIQQSMNPNYSMIWTAKAAQNRHAVGRKLDDAQHWFKFKQEVFVTCWSSQELGDDIACTVPFLCHRLGQTLEKMSSTKFPLISLQSTYFQEDRTNRKCSQLAAAQ